MLVWNVCHQCHECPACTCTNKETLTLPPRPLNCCLLVDGVLFLPPTLLATTLHTHLHQLLLEFLDLGEVQLAEDVVHQAGRRPEQLVLLGRRDAVVVVDGVGELGEAVVAVQGLVVVGLGGGVVAELQAVQGDAERAERKKGSRALKKNKKRRRALAVSVSPRLYL